PPRAPRRACRNASAARGAPAAAPSGRGRSVPCSNLEQLVGFADHLVPVLAIERIVDGADRVLDPLALARADDRDAARRMPGDEGDGRLERAPPALGPLGDCRQA